MHRAPDDVIHALADVARRYPVLVEWLGEWRTMELERLPSVGQNVALAQGRCQVLGELVKLVQQSPDLAAKPRGGS